MDHRVKTVMELMEANLQRKMSMVELARAVNLSPWRLSHLFKSEIGTPPLQYLKGLRLEKARVLVMTTFLSIKQIMNIAGITNESHFVKDFRRAYGLTPTQYRTRFFSKG